MALYWSTLPNVSRRIPSLHTSALTTPVSFSARLSPTGSDLRRAQPCVRTSVPIERSLWGSFTHQQIFMKNFIVGRYREAKQKKKTWKKSNAAVCLYVYPGGVVTLCLHPNDLQQAWRWGLDKEEPLVAVTKDEFFESFQRGDWRHSLVTLPATSSERAHLVAAIRQKRKVEIAIVNNRTLRDVEYFNSLHDVRRQAIARHEVINGSRTNEKGKSPGMNWVELVFAHKPSYVATVDFSGYVKKPSAPCNCGTSCEGSMDDDSISSEGTSGASGASRSKGDCGASDASGVSGSSGLSGASCDSGEDGDESSSGGTAPSPRPSLGPVSSSTDNDEGSDDTSSSDFSLTRVGRTTAECAVGTQGPTADHGAPATSSLRRRPFRRVAAMATRPEARGGAGATVVGTDTSAQQELSSRSNWSTVGSSHGGALVARGSSRNNRRVGSVASGSGGDSDGFHATMRTTRRREPWACQPPTTAATSRTSVTSTTASDVRRSALVTRDSSSKSACKESPGGGFEGRRDGNVPTARATSGAVLQSAASLARMSRFISGGAAAAPRMVSSSAARLSAPTIGNGAKRCEMAVPDITRPTSPSAAWKMDTPSALTAGASTLVLGAILDRVRTIDCVGARGAQDTPSTTTAGASTLLSGAPLDRTRTAGCVGDSGIQHTPSTSTARVSNLLSGAPLDRARTTGCVAVVANGPKDDTIVGERGGGSDTDRFGVTSVGTPLPTTLVIAEGSDGTCKGLALADRSLVFGTLSESDGEWAEEETKEEGHLREEKYNEPQADPTNTRSQAMVSGKGTAPSNPGEVTSNAATEASPSTPPSPSVSPVPTANGSVVGSPNMRATAQSESSTSSAPPQSEQAPVLVDTAENMGATDVQQKKPVRLPQASRPSPAFPSPPLGQVEALVAMAGRKDGVGLQETDMPGATRYPSLCSPSSSQLSNRVVARGMIWKNDATGVRDREEPAEPLRSPSTPPLASSSPSSLSSPSGQAISLPEAAIGGVAMGVVQKNDTTGVQDTEEPAGPFRSPPTPPLASSSPSSLSSPSGQAISIPEAAIGGVAMGVVRKNDATGVQDREESAGPLRSPSTPPLASSSPSSLSSPSGQSSSLSEVAAWGETAVSEEEVHLLDIELAVRRKDGALQEAQCQIELLLREKGAASDEAARDTTSQLREKDEALKIAEETLGRADERQRELSTQLAKSLHGVSLRETELETALRQRGQEDKRGNDENKKIRAAMRQVEEESALAHTRFESLREHATREVSAAQQKATEKVRRAQLRYESLCERTLRESAAAEARANREAEAVQEKAREKARGADDRYDALHVHTADKLAEREQAERQLSQSNKKMEREVLRLTKEVGKLVMLAKQSELKAETVEETENLRRKLAAAEFESAADLAETRLTADSKEQKDAVESVKQGELKYAECRAAADTRFAAAEARVTDLNERLADMMQQATTTAGAASEHALMLQERVEALGEDLEEMADHAAAADDRSAAAEARVTDLNEGIAVLQRQATVAAGDASEHAAMLQERIGLLGEDLAGMTDRAAAADVRSTVAEARVTDLNEGIAVLRLQATVAEREASEHASMLQDRIKSLGQDLERMPDRASAAEARSTTAEERVADLNERLHAPQRRATAVTAAGEASEHASMLQEGAEALSQDLRGMTDATVAESRAALLATSAGFSAAGAGTTNEYNNDDELINRALERVASVDVSIARYTEASAELLSAADRAPEVITHETPRSRARSQGIEVAAVGRVAGAEVRAVELGLGNARLRALAVAGNEESKEEEVDEEVRARRFHLSAENSHSEREVAYGNASPHERARWEADARLEGTVEGEAEKESANGCHWRAAMADLARST
ncbi:unnamed protein product [Ectocarpus sp. CCAP 1310/34]|nr:unnamed protein product [Ectocarpus sp. CCAP 1310/34]